MEKKGAKLSDVEPLVKESLSVRREYWSETMYEAVNCHLYAKLLSRFGKKLDLLTTRSLDRRFLDRIAKEEILIYEN